MWHYYLLMWQRLFKFSGRAMRSEYWWALLAHFIVTVVVLIVFIGSCVIALYGELISDVTVDTATNIMVLAIIAIILFLTLATVSLQVRRFHDIGLSGWVWLFCFLVPVWVFAFLTWYYEGLRWIAITSDVVNLVSMIATLALSAKDSDPYDNKYGYDPKAGEVESFS